MASLVPGSLGVGECCCFGGRRSGLVTRGWDLANNRTAVAVGGPLAAGTGEEREVAGGGGAGRRVHGRGHTLLLVKGPSLCDNTRARRHACNA